MSEGFRAGVAPEGGLVAEAGSPVVLDGAWEDPMEVSRYFWTQATIRASASSEEDGPAEEEGRVEFVEDTAVAPDSGA